MLSRLDTVLLDLLVEWDALKAAGTPVTVEEFCRRLPERGEEIRLLIDRVGHVDSVLFQTGRVNEPVISGYELNRELGRGGMGVVYEAHDVGLDRTVAIKVPHGRAATPEYLKRFQREVRTLAKLRHPNIVPIHSTGVADGVPYFVMGYVDGGNLRVSTETPERTPEAVAALLEQVARAVGHAHALGVVHRDLKPANILIDTAGEPHVSDFGVAALLAGEPVATSSGDTPGGTASAETRLTRTGVGVGTPAYAAPESVTGAAARPTPAVDVWSLGVVLYECLTGRLPYPGYGGRNRPPTPPTQYRPELPRELEAVVLRCLAPVPSDRYATGTDLADALARVRRRCQTRRTLRAVGRVALAMAFVVAAFGWWFWPENAADRHARLSQTLAAQLAADSSAELVPSSGFPVTHRVRLNEALTRTGVAADDNMFYADSPRPSLIELLPDAPAEGFRLRAEVCHERGLGQAEVGLYFGHSQTRVGGVPTHQFLFLAFADRGLSARTFALPDGELGGALELRGFRYREGDPPAGMWKRLILGRATYRPANANARLFRKLVLEVSPDKVVGTLDGIIRVESEAKVIHPTFVTRPFPSGGVGIFVNSSHVSVRECVVEKP